MYLNESIIESTLNVINVESSDVGRYTCIASNTIGTDRSSGVLTVNGKYTYVYVHRWLDAYGCVYYRCC